MAAAFLTAVFFALSAAFGTRSTRMLGAIPANFARQWLGACALAAWAHIFGRGLGGAGLPVFILSGVVGFGFGDLALYAALPLLGSRLAALMVQCLAAPFAAVIEWCWLGTVPAAAELICGGVILAGVVIALAPDKWARLNAPPDAADRVRGLFFGVVAALGQGGGAVISRKANLLARAADSPVDGGTAAYQRLIGGLAVVSISYAIARWAHRPVQPAAAMPWRAAWPWVGANALAGTVLGVSCYQWALATTPSAVVLPIVALTPLVVIPFSYFMEHERPSARSLLGGLLAVAAAATLASLRRS